MELGLKDRRVLITGGSQGIGKAVAQGFLAEGAEVVIVARDPQRLEQALAELAPLGRISGRAIDLAQRGAPEAVADAYKETDILVNNAGAIPTGDIFSIDETRWREAWDLKVFGYVNLMRAMYRHMRGRRPKVIVNVLGLGGEKPQWHYVCGNAANVALMGVTESLGGRSIDDGIRVVGVNPGGVETERMINNQKKRAEREFGDATRWREFFKDKPLQRAASTEEIADVVLFLASDRASWITGTVVRVDGGFLHRDGWF
jgi:NAD(P)-dependent dehydrogenase (short-subunit alcohol dehydrogenase family)